MFENRNVALFLSRPIKILKVFGVWPASENLQPHELCIYWIYNVFILSTQWSFLLFEFMYIAKVLGDMDELSESSFLLFTQASLCYKTTVFLLNKKNLKILIGLMEEDIFRPRNKVHVGRLELQAKIIRRLCLFFIICANTTCSLWALIPLFDNSGPRIFPFKIWMPVNPEHSPDYELGYFYQMIAIYISACLFCGVDSVALCTMMFGCAQLEIIGEKLLLIRNVPLSSKALQTNGQRNEQAERIKENIELLKDCIKHHQAVIKFIKLIEDTFHANIFFQLSGTVGIICIIGLRISVVDPHSVQFTSMINYMMTMLSQLFLYCWCGQELTIRSERLRQWVYQCPWYEQDCKFRRSLWIAMARMSKPIIFRAGHYIPLSRATFIQILRSSYSYFAVLNQAKNK
ncbi:hypothetical protein O0L34_g10987 [Tuta absoluta]|nr:hypothetical protein O0L34_g10987 [Tuta absoluta]